MLPRRLLVLTPLLLAPLALAPLLGAGCSTAPAPPRRVVLVTLDTLRLDAFLGGPGVERSLVRLGNRAEQKGLIFDRYYSATSTTQPTHATLLTGLNPWQHGVARNGLPLAEKFETVAERLQAAGWSTAAVVASFPVHGQFGFAQGFDRFSDHFDKGAVTAWSGVDRKGQEEFYSPADKVTNRALRDLDQAEGEKQFFWFHYFDAHAPYGDTVRKSDGTKLAKVLEHIEEHGGDDGVVAEARELYDEDVRFLDQHVERLLARLDQDAREKGIETHVVVTSDHGEGFGDAGSLGHGKRLTADQIHVPCFVISPRVKPGRRQEAVGSLDVHATLLSLAGIPYDGPGRDLTASKIPAARVAGMRRTFTKPYNEIRTDGKVHVVDGLQFYVVEGDEVFTGNHEALELYDREPYSGPRADEVRAVFDGFTQELAALGDLEELLDEGALQKLEALGYVGDDTEHE